MAELTIHFDARAAKDLEAAVEWYDTRGANLGDRFLERVDELLGRLTEHPQLYSTVEDEIRRALVRQFPFAVYYLLEGQTLRVLAILHTSRRPDYWRDRED